MLRCTFMPEKRTGRYSRLANLVMFAVFVFFLFVAEKTIAEYFDFLAMKLI